MNAEKKFLDRTFREVLAEAKGWLFVLSLPAGFLFLLWSLEVVSYFAFDGPLPTLPDGTLGFMREHGLLWLLRDCPGTGCSY